MPRPHIEFIFSQALQWQPHAPLPGREAAEFKTLSLDSELGELSALMRLRHSWCGSVTSQFEEEIYVLAGELAIDGKVLGRDGYFRLPARTTREWATDGVVAVVMQNVVPNGTNDGFVAIDTLALPWDRSGLPDELEFMNLARKPLFTDPDGRYRTWLLSVAPQIRPAGATLASETHSCVEEMFMLAGDVSGPLGVMTAGAYFWRPPGILHGPFGSRTGALALFRWRHGIQDTKFHSNASQFSFEAPYSPNLPAALAHLSESVPAQTDRF